MSFDISHGIRLFIGWIIPIGLPCARKQQKIVFPEREHGQIDEGVGCGQTADAEFGWEQSLSGKRGRQRQRLEERAGQHPGQTQHNGGQHQDHLGNHGQQKSHRRKTVKVHA